jgi:hypothetical protein
LNKILKRQTSRFHYGSKVPAVNGHNNTELIMQRHIIGHHKKYKKEKHGATKKQGVNAGAREG